MTTFLEFLAEKLTAPVRVSVVEEVKEAPRPQRREALVYKKPDRDKILLSEGMIKLPQKLLTDVTKQFEYWALAHVAHHGLRFGRDKDDQQFILKAVQRAAREVGVKMPTAYDIGKAGMNKTVLHKHLLGDLSPDYLRGLARVSGASVEDVKKLFRDFEIRLKMYFGPIPASKEEEDRGAYWSRATQEVGVSVSHAKLTSEFFDDLSSYNSVQLTRRLHAALGTVEHELSHGMQDLVLRFLHSEQGEPRGDAQLRGKGKKEYYLQRIEFDPWIKSSVRTFRTVVQKHKAEKDLTRIKELFAKFTQGEDSEFFATLREHDPSRWRKAVKLAWSSYEEKYL